MKRSTVYVPMSADIIHPGHIHLLKEANQHGEVIVGLLSDEAIRHKKGRLPVMNYDERYEVVTNLVGVSKVIQQKTSDYIPNLQELRPEFVVHGNDWTSEARQSVLETIKQWNGKLIKTDYSSSPTTSTNIKKRLTKYN